MRRAVCNVRRVFDIHKLAGKFWSIMSTVINIPSWIEENKKFFLPPVCNKMMHQKGQMKAFFVGGPNNRKDYHIEEGEEFFYMRKGDMCLKVVEQNQHKDIHIKEGEVFLLPAFIPHSPQRQEGTIGLVLERERAEEEKDGLRYFVDGTLDSLYEEWFHCEDLGAQLGPIIKRFFASEQCKTGKPIPGTIPENPPIKIDTKRKLEPPFNLKEWITKNLEEINKQGYKSLWNEDHQFSVRVYGSGETTISSEVAETWLCQLEGTSDLAVGTEKMNKLELTKDDSFLIPVNEKCALKLEEGSLCLVCVQDPTRKKKPEE
ncbi:3-hydroxyanthranilate 3,4-dioxygenase-like [Anneissia japonica]|uniref:3-hydroxyanthranilate 3,4-dioxygenase-like n=1 Tax=Anneissia japonica TaxID=1529436 RepID=UPI001425991C|nr:3-hydroxyanthranilate 3,4-dioxygenase-like [Anneissia japonica]